MPFSKNARPKGEELMTRTIVALSLALVLAGCGGDKKKTDDKQPEFVGPHGYEVPN